MAGTLDLTFILNDNTKIYVHDNGLFIFNTTISEALKSGNTFLHAQGSTLEFHMAFYNGIIAAN